MADDISVAMPRGPGGYRYQGVQRLLPAGTQVGSTDYAVQHILLVDANDVPLLVSVAHDAPDAGNGIKIQGRAVATAPAAVANNDRVDSWFDTFGRVAVKLVDQFNVGLFSGPNAATDTFANPTTSSVISHLMAWVPGNTAWERLQSASGSLKAVLTAGTALIGKVGIDQTTPGTTDSVTVATGQGAGATIGATGDAVVAAGASGSLSAKLRAISRDIVANIVLAAGTNIIGSIGGLGIMAATTTIPIASDSADEAVVSALANNRLFGFSFRENAGSTASFILRHGTSTAGDPLAYVTLAPNESTREWFGPNGKVCSSGVYLDMVSGTIIGQLDTLAVA